MKKNRNIIYLDADVQNDYEEQSIINEESTSIHRSARSKFHKKAKSQENLPFKTITLLAMLLIAVTLMTILVKYIKASGRISPFQEQLEKQQLQKASLIVKMHDLERQIFKLKQSNQKDSKNEKVDKGSQKKEQAKVVQPEKPKQAKPAEKPKQVKPILTFDVPKLVWVYLTNDIDQEKYLTQLGFENIKHYASQSSFELRIVDKENFKYWLKEDSAKAVDSILDKLRDNQYIENSIDHITKQIIIMHLMKQNGGVFIDYRLIFVEKLDWLKNIHESIIANRGNKNVKPKYFAFHNIDASPRWERKNRDVEFEMEKLVFAFPGITDNFLAGLPNGQFINDLLKFYIPLVEADPNKRNFIISSNNLQRANLNHMNNNDIYCTAAHLAIQSKQSELDKNQNEKFYKFAIDYYGLTTINENYATQKMGILFKNRMNTRDYSDNFYNFLAKLPQEQFQEVIGPIRFVINPQPFDHKFNERLEKAKKNEQYEIWQGSFIHKQLYLNKSENFIKKNKEKPSTPTTFKQWGNLPRKVWMYWDKGIENASAANQLCALNIIKNAKLANFQVFQVNDNNLKDFISQEEIDKIQKTIIVSRQQAIAQMKSDFIRLALIAKHGGVFMDVSYLWLEGFQWIVDIAKEPTHYIFNRYGETPKVLLQFHSLQGAPFDWTINQKSNTKSSWYLAYENNLIIAEKDNSFIKEWYDLLHQFFSSPFQKTETKMIECNTNDYRWTHPKSRSLTALDALKAVIGCRQHFIEKQPQRYQGVQNAADYYKIWSFNGFNGLQKFQYYNDYTFAFGGAINNDPEAIYRLSIDYNEATIGKVYKGIKMSTWNIASLNTFLQKNYKSNFSNQTHPSSYFNKYLYNKGEHEFFSTDKLHVKSKQ